MDEKLNKLSKEVIGAAIRVHQELGPGLLESVYQRCLLIELQSIGISAEIEVPVEVKYRGQLIDGLGYRLDLLVEDSLIVELKSVEAVKPVHKKQLLTYLKLTGCRLGLLINFNESLLRDGVTRVAN
ncbi:GxxExxY protein [Pontiellaceae bacterium B12227]|nr:GxxExxY protein [Pontiellaceae bacterium B12227]